jgi:DNA modification methylase
MEDNALSSLLNRITCGDCVQLAQQLPDNSIDAVVIDPPYGESQGYYGDSDIRTARTGLRRFLEVVEPKLKRNAHLAVFWTMRNLDVCIDDVKSVFTFSRVVTMYLPKGNARPYLGWLPRTQAIVIGQKYFGGGQPSDFHYKLSSYLAQKLNESGLTRSELARILDCDSRLVMKWTRPGDPAWCLPTPRFYPKLKALLHLGDEFDFLETRESAVHDRRKDFEYKHDCYIVDDKNEEMLHPAMKPLSVIKHLVECMCPTGGIVLDGFCGSGTTALAAKLTGRNFVCCDVSEKYCEIARRRLKNESNN